MSEEFEEAADEFEDDGEPEFEGEIDEDLAVLDEEDVADPLLDDAVDVIDDIDVIDDDVPVVTTKVKKAGEEAEDDDDDVVDLDEELHPDDVEEALDVVLRERNATAGLDDEEDEEEEVDDRGDGTKIVPRRPGEFLCSSCFLVLPRNQLADEGRSLCHDCV